MKKFKKKILKGETDSSSACLFLSDLGEEFVLVFCLFVCFYNWNSLVTPQPWDSDFLMLLLLLLSHFSRVQLCATPQMAAH